MADIDRILNRTYSKSRLNEGVSHSSPENAPLMKLMGECDDISDQLLKFEKQVLKMQDKLSNLNLRSPMLQKSVTALSGARGAVDSLRKSIFDAGD